MDFFANEQAIYNEAMAVTGESAMYQKLLNDYGNFLERVRTFNLWTRQMDLQNPANLDEATGIFSRAYFDNALAKVIQNMTRADDVLSVMLVSIDKSDDVGNACLRLVAETLSRNLYRGDDFVARYDKFEFAVVLPRTPQEGAEVVTERTLAMVRELEGAGVTVSIGVATNRPHVKVAQAAIYLNRVKNALFQAQEDGGNRACHIEL